MGLTSHSGLLDRVKVRAPAAAAPADYTGLIVSHLASSKPQVTPLGQQVMGWELARIILSIMLNDRTASASFAAKPDPKWAQQRDDLLTVRRCATG